MKKRILVSITTFGDTSWEEKIKEVEQLRLKEVALFVSSLSTDKRQHCYNLLSNIPGLTIPVVHARSDMPAEEYALLIHTFKTRRFNLHPLQQYPLLYNIDIYKPLIFIENVHNLGEEKDLRKFAGICLDLSHLENYRLLDPQTYQQVCSLLTKLPIGFNHISAIKKIAIRDPGDKNNLSYACHTLQDIEEMSYVDQYPAHYFAEYMALELTNTIKDQLKIKEYLDHHLHLSS